MRQRITLMGWGDRPGTGTGDEGGGGPPSSSYRQSQTRNAGRLSDRFVRYAEDRGLSMRPKMAFPLGVVAVGDRIIHGKANGSDVVNGVRQQYQEEEGEDMNNSHANPQEDGAPDSELRHDHDDGEGAVGEEHNSGREEARVRKSDDASVPQDARPKYDRHPLPQQRALRQAGTEERFDLDPDACLDLDPAFDLDLDLDPDPAFDLGGDGVDFPSPMTARADVGDSATGGDECDDGEEHASGPTPTSSAPSFFDLVERAQDEITRRRVATRLRRVLELSSSAAADVRRLAADRRRRRGRRGGKHQRPGLICSISSVLSRDDDDDYYDDNDDDEEEGRSDCEYGEEEEVTFSPTGFSEVARGEESGVQEAEDIAREMEREVEWWGQFKSGSGTSPREGCGE